MALGHGAAFCTISSLEGGILGEKMGVTFLMRPRGLGREKECVNNGEDRFPYYHYFFLDLGAGTPVLRAAMDSFVCITLLLAEEGRMWLRAWRKLMKRQS